MPERVRVNALLDIGLTGEAAEECSSRTGRTAACRAGCRTAALLEAQLAADVDPPGQRVSRAGMETAGGCLVALAVEHADGVLAEVDVGGLERRDSLAAFGLLLAVRSREPPSGCALRAAHPAAAQLQR